MGNSEQCLQALLGHCPWLRRIILVHAEETAPLLSRQDRRVECIHTRLITAGDVLWGPEAYLHTIPGLGEYFLIVPADHLLQRDYRPLDFFTPNGIPLLPLRKTGKRKGFFKGYSRAPGIIAQTKENAQAFLRREGRAGAGPDAPLGHVSIEYFDALAQWAFFSGKAAPVPY